MPEGKALFFTAYFRRAYSEWREMHNPQLSTE